MKHASFPQPLPMLAPGERPARIALLTAPQLHLILVAARAPLRKGAAGWYGPARDRPFDRRTVNALLRMGILFAPYDRTARLTACGKWHARTLCSAIAAGPSTVTTTTAEGVETCHIEN